MYPLWQSDHSQTESTRDAAFTVSKEPECRMFVFELRYRAISTSNWPRNGFMRAFICKDGRVLGFDAVEWLTWFAAVNVVALITLVI